MGAITREARKGRFIDVFDATLTELPSLTLPAGATLAVQKHFFGELHDGSGNVCLWTRFLRPDGHAIELTDGFIYFNAEDDFDEAETVERLVSNLGISSVYATAKLRETQLFSR